MAETGSSKVERLRERNRELEALVTRWEHANDPESKWMLYLLREALEMGRLQLKRLQREHEHTKEAACGAV